MASIIDHLIRARLLLQRLISAVLGVLGVALLRAGYPPGGDDGFVLLFVGGLLVLFGVIGVFDPARTLPAGGTSE